MDGDILARLAAGDVLLEIPAGTLDVDAATGAVEDPEIASRRELEEETGYRPERIEIIGRFASSPGMVSETFSLVRAHGLTKVGNGGGAPGENITVHRVPLSQIAAFIAAKRAQGLFMDVKLLTLLGAGLLD